jgi:hypothetical protein
MAGTSMAFEREVWSILGNAPFIALPNVCFSGGGLARAIRDRSRALQACKQVIGAANKQYGPFCQLELEVSMRRRSGSLKAWIKVKNPKSPAATRALDGTF